MANHLEIYKCEQCGNMVEILHSGPGAISCCGELMRLQAENTVDASREKHLPVPERTGEEVVVRVGSIPHPMEEAHFIEWIEVIADGRVHRQQLHPGQAPAASFPVRSSRFTVRAYCNLHGQWAIQG